ncbi:hypothetical protein EVAR_42467_1 [Eumeta japonica]|uniref:Uncharacterized protein n=1 Tax=Eumeta variegata TaxID=151549 RepID=A0A4C1XYJ3_EUMVA|nr:hypothetical protein EVAR_42467_1 [Eumeta japonica]
MNAMIATPTPRQRLRKGTLGAKLLIRILHCVALKRCIGGRHLYPIAVSSRPFFTNTREDIGTLPPRSADFGKTTTALRRHTA